jgi:myo-inositol-1(or 4)-monophosphatase
VGESGQDALAIARSATGKAGLIIAEHLHLTKEIAFKGRGNIVTEVDCLSEQAIIEPLRTEFPHHGIISEESPETLGSEPYIWIIDPLDGTTNYAAGIPMISISMALVSGGVPLLGIVMDPVRGEIFEAVRGRGATLNGEPITTSQVCGLEDSVIGLDLGYDPVKRGQMLDLAGSIHSDVQAIRMLGSAVLGLAYIAAGRLNLYCHRGLNSWDLAAGTLLEREAGGTVVDWAGEPITMGDSGVVAGNTALVNCFFERHGREIPV